MQPFAGLLSAQVPLPRESPLTIVRNCNRWTELSSHAPGGDEEVINPAVGGARHIEIRQHGHVSDTGATPDDSALTREVLVDLEREPMGLYEVWYAANSLYPRAPMSARVAAAERVIRRLVADERVRLWRGRWIGPQHDRERVSTDDLAEVLLMFSTWAPEDGNPIVWMELTTDA